jgi:hypothetical protein
MNLFQKAQKLQKTQSTNCLICNSEFEPKLSDLERGWGMFCSKNCSSSWRNKVKYKKVTKQEIREYKIRKLGIS